jgi:hypothetical protein
VDIEADGLIFLSMNTDAEQKFPEEKLEGSLNQPKFADASKSASGDLSMLPKEYQKTYRKKMDVSNSGRWTLAAEDHKRIIQETMDQKERPVIQKDKNGFKIRYYFAGSRKSKWYKEHKDAVAFANSLYRDVSNNGRWTLAEEDHKRIIQEAMDKKRRPVIKKDKKGFLIFYYFAGSQTSK